MRSPISRSPDSLRADRGFAFQPLGKDKMGPGRIECSGVVTAEGRDLKHGQPYGAHRKSGVLCERNNKSPRVALLSPHVTVGGWGGLAVVWD